MTSTPLISVVIPSFNYARFLGDCLSSIFSQVDAPPFEIVLVDDGSTDETAEVLETFADPRLRVVRHDQNRGHVATINEALPLTRGTFIARIDPDDRYRPHFLATVCRILESHPDVGFCTAGLRSSMTAVSRPGRLPSRLMRATTTAANSSGCSSATSSARRPPPAGGTRGSSTCRYRTALRSTTGTSAC